MAEAGFFPGITFYLATWFPAEYRARMLAWFLVAIPASTVVGGPLSGALLQLDGLGGLPGWKWLFIIEGLPAALMGVAALWVLPDRPDDAAFLSDEERRLVRDRIQSERRDKEMRQLLPALKDPRVLILAVAQFGFTAGSYGVGIWLPQIIKDAQLSNLAVGFVTALIGITSARAIFWTIPTRFLTGLAAAGGLAFINSVGTLGGFVGPYAVGWLRDTTGSFSAGLMAMAGLLVLATAMSSSLHFFVKQE